MMLRKVLMVASLAALADPAAHAIGFARAPSNVALGSPLNFPIGVQLGADEALIANCVSAEVFQGEQRVPPSNVRIAIEPGATADERVVRVTTGVAIEEPLVSITATLGCVNKVERRFTVFADPPVVTLAAAPPPPPPPAPPVAAAPVAPASAPEPVREPVPERSSAAPAAQPAASAPPRRVVRATPPRPAASAVVATPRTAAAAGPRGASPVARAPAVAASAPQSRLKLDSLEPVAKASAAASAAQEDAALRVAAAAASAVLAAQAASTAQANADLATERLKAMEQALETVRAEAKRDRDQLAQMRARQTDGETLKRYMPWLVGALVVLLGLVVWLWVVLRRTQREQRAQWYAAAAAAKEPPANPPTLQPMTLPPHLAPTPPVRPGFGGGTVTPPAPATPAAAAAFGAASTMFPDSVMAGGGPARDVSIEELIDLEQQAEFFIVLGQDDAAIDLLMGHIRSSGGTSALPYLKLLEIYRRQGDRESYERTRARFNHRFNAYAPDWDTDLQHGRSLVDYPSVIERLQRCWSSPIDAMAELESLVFRRDAGELFELPAYREVLFLYSMARDLAEHQGGPATTIDVMLPLEEGTFETTTAHPHLITMSAMGDLNELGRATEAPIEVLSAAIKPAQAFSVTDHGTPVDLDLTSPLPMEGDRRDDDDQRSDYMNLPPAPPRRG